MGGKWSKRSVPGWNAIRERMRRTEPAAGRGGSSISRTWNNVEHSQLVIQQITMLLVPGYEAQQEEEEEVGFPVRPQVPLRPMTYKGALDLSHFLREKGGLEGLVYSQKRQEILDLWVYHTQGYFPDWQNYTPGPGTRFPLTFGWCFKLVPVDPDKVEEVTEGENNCLLHPMNQHGMDDPEREVLVWRFDSSLAFHHRHRAAELHPEYFKNC
uniref:Protein Nef n=1 Tax=Human immunodeficiency virus type 1 TaxID=11676 RepID=Q8Q5Z8_HV1|nr:nef protein [Human immunodeficiency virus 1]